MFISSNYSIHLDLGIFPKLVNIESKKIKVET